MESGPVLVTETRNDRVQAVHHGHAVLLAADGSVEEAWGDPATPTYWRSAPKPLQAIPFARVMGRLGLGDEALALACASHSGEAEHVALAERILAAADLDASALRCASHPPMTAHSVRVAGGQQAIHNNCSGKHAAMLAACVANDWPVSGYDGLDHPLQHEIIGLLRAATGASEVPTGIDGCGLPTFWLPVQDLARVYQWLQRHDDGRRCLDAMAAHPWLVAGTERFCTELGRASAGRLVGKVGAAGVYVILDRQNGGALAVKVGDGSGLAAETLAGAIARRAGWLPDDALHDFVDRPVRSCDGRVLGRYQVHL